VLVTTGSDTTSGIVTGEGDIVSDKVTVGAATFNEIVTGSGEMVIAPNVISGVVVTSVMITADGLIVKL